MKTPMFLLEIVLAAGCLNLGAASSPYTLEAPPGQYTNGVSHPVWHYAAAGPRVVDPAPPAPEAPPTVGAPAALHGFYADAFVNLTTPDFSHSEAFSYGLGVGYQWTPVFSTDLRVTHAGLNIENNAVSTVGGRIVSRLPFSYLSPFVFAGAAFDLGPNQWRLQPGLGAEIGASKLMTGMSLFGEAGLDADLKGHSGYLFSAGIRWRF